MSILRPMAERPTMEGQISIYEEDVIADVIYYRPKTNEVKNCAANHSFEWETFLTSTATGWTYFNEKTRVKWEEYAENRHIARPSIFSIIVALGDCNMWDWNISCTGLTYAYGKMEERVLNIVKGGSERTLKEAQQTAIERFNEIVPAQKLEM